MESNESFIVCGGRTPVDQSCSGIIASLHSQVLAEGVVQRSEKFANPFYGLLLAAGILFALTAVCYGVMAFHDARPAAAGAVGPVAAAPADHPLLAWMRRHGEVALLVELAFLAVFTFAAIGTDDYWQRRKAASKEQDRETANVH